MVAAYYADEAKKATTQAKRLLSKAGVPFKEMNLIGEPGTVIADVAGKGKFDLIVMGSHGHAALSNLVMGSCTTKVLSLSKVPVLVVR
jgi:nucleotide-binding universal stress UspA family protein